jgi:hypothetical protein
VSRRIRQAARIAYFAVPFGVLFAAAPREARTATLEVGPGRAFDRIEDAAARARPGDAVLVHPLPENRPYQRVAVLIRRPRIAFRAFRAKGGHRVAVSGKGFDYSGRGRTPRAIFQFDRGADGCLLEGFELRDAHNGSQNGAGVRVNQANQVTVRDCEIHRNDMGMMSNSDGTQATMVGLLIDGCVIHHNGSFEHPGYNHNLYLGGTSVTLRSCEVHSSLTGHNVKTRAHCVRVEYCLVHHSANREMDLVDAVDTTRPGSHAVLLGNVIVKDPDTRGNKAVIHFGQDGGKDHDGTVYLVHNTIVTPFISPVLDLSAPGARAKLTGNIVWDGGNAVPRQKLLETRGGARPERVAGSRNWLAWGFRERLERQPAAGLDRRQQVFGARGVRLPFAGPDYRLAHPVAGIVDAGLPLARLDLPEPPGAPRSQESSSPLAWQYVHPARREERKTSGLPDLGAHEYRGR